MAVLSTNTTTTTRLHSAARPSLWARIKAGYGEYLHLISRSDQIEALNALSDEALAKRGLSRDRIVAHVFADRAAY